jgi:hypothetical protein
MRRSASMPMVETAAHLTGQRLPAPVGAAAGAGDNLDLETLLM